MNKCLTRVGTSQYDGANCAVVFRRVRCAGCDGRCGVSVGGGELPVDGNLPDGTMVEVVTSARNLVFRALGIFGWPLGVIVVVAAVAEWSDAGDFLVAAALPAAVLAVFAIRAGFAIRDQIAPRVSELPAGSGRFVRVFLE